MAGLPEEATAQVVDPGVLDGYARWVAAQGERADADPYYAVPRCRFELSDDDVVQSVGDVVAGPAECGTRISSERARVRMDVCGVRPPEASALLAAIDGARTVARARSMSCVDEGVCRKFLDGAFGTVVFAPHAVSELEARVSASEIVRYPGSPYEVVRAYWSNMGDVADRSRAAGTDLDTVPAFIRFLRELNVLALVGSSGRSFYLPASPIAARGRVRPGELWTSASVVEPSAAGGLRFVSGPRVNASRIGGNAYQTLLSIAHDDPDALASARDFRDAAGLPWGRIVFCRADGDEREALWFCPPRPIETRHLESLRDAFHRAEAAAGRDDPEVMLGELASFHQRFVRLHPFRAANQCVATSLVNHVLRRSHGAGVPHLVLDHLALQLSAEAYARAFALAVRHWLVAGKSPVERHLELIIRKQRCFDFLTRLAESVDTDAALALVHEHPEDACLALLDPGRLPEAAGN